MSQFENNIRNHAPSFTKAEKRIAAYMLAHQSDLLFETAASIAKKVETTSMTVGRFLRTLGYQGIDELKKDLKHVQAQQTLPVLERFKAIESTTSIDGLAECLEAELTGISAVYEIMATQLWHDIVHLLHTSSKVYVSSFATIEGIADSFVARLRYVRSGVQLVTGRGGMYLDVFGDIDQNCCMVIIDDRRYAKASRKLAALCKEQNIAVILITDEYCLWATEYTNHHLAVPTAMPSFWTSLAPMMSLLTHLVNAVIAEGDDILSDRIEKIGELQSHFDFFED